MAPLFLRWLFHGSALAMVLGVVALAIGVVVLTFILLALAVWPVMLLGGFVLLAAWSGRLGPFRRHAVTAPAAPPRSLPAAPAAVERADALPPSVRERVERIRHKADALAGGGGSPQDRHLVRSTVDHYLPAAVEAYLSLPAGSSEWPATADGRSGLRLLEDQLDLLEWNLDEIAGHAWQDGTDRLLAHERFLRERLGAEHTGDLDLPRR